MSNSLAIRNQSDVITLGDILAKSGYFTDVRQGAQAVVKIMAAMEMGFGPIAGMTGVYIVNNRPTISANLMASAIKRSGRYNYKILVLDDTNCKIEFFEMFNGKMESTGVSSFSAKDAERAGVKNMQKFPRNMLFARALSNGCRWYCPDVTGGPIYTPEELGADVDIEGDVIDMSVIGDTASYVQPEVDYDANPAPKSWKEIVSVLSAVNVDPKVVADDIKEHFNGTWDIARIGEYWSYITDKYVTPAMEAMEAEVNNDTEATTEA